MCFNGFITSLSYERKTARKNDNKASTPIITESIESLPIIPQAQVCIYGDGRSSDLSQPGASSQEQSLNDILHSITSCGDLQQRVLFRTYTGFPIGEHRSPNLLNSNGHTLVQKTSEIPLQRQNYKNSPKPQKTNIAVPRL